jgi:dihydrodipicolinate synthase/N-acetylneuraminate lyase
MDQLWVPVLTHYRNGRPDVRRIGAHIRALRPQVRSILLAGLTGDGWELDDATFVELLTVLEDHASCPPEINVMIAILRNTTADVMARIERVKTFLESAKVAATFSGIAVCPPVDPDADQGAIFDHYDAVLEATPWPLAVYQLPQITGCTIQPQTLERLAGHSSKVVMFKDSSGADLVASSGRDFGAVKLLRGAEGDYADHLMPEGRYHGWLLSTGNAFARPLRTMLEQRAAGELKAARQVSERLTRAVSMLFAKAAELPYGNAFSNANRAADHVMAHGREWRAAMAPETISGQRLPVSLLETAERAIGELLGPLPQGYVSVGSEAL